MNPLPKEQPKKLTAIDRSIARYVVRHYLNKYQGAIAVIERDIARDVAKSQTRLALIGELLPDHEIKVALSLKIVPKSLQEKE
jgi:hypothetical protein